MEGKDAIDVGRSFGEVYNHVNTSVGKLADSYNATIINLDKKGWGVNLPFFKKTASEISNLTIKSATRFFSGAAVGAAGGDFHSSLLVGNFATNQTTLGTAVKSGAIALYTEYGGKALIQNTVGQVLSSSVDSVFPGWGETAKSVSDVGVSVIMSSGVNFAVDNMSSGVNFVLGKRNQPKE
ncbi:MAG: hypothetical protein VX777_04630 [Chlamydiota bacterium]|nr:hypothetical protein [Chlamydiota bacterium]